MKCLSDLPARLARVARIAWIARITGIASWVAASGVPEAFGHTHLEIVHREGRLRILHYDFDYGEADPATLRLTVGPAAAKPVPATPAFTNLLGAAGGAVWILPQQENPELLWLGIGTESLDPSVFVGNVGLRLEKVEGPGHFALYFDDPFGRPVPSMNTRDGVDASDTLVLRPGSHLHGNWAFSAPGAYRVRWVATGTLRAGSAAVVSEPAEFHFDVVAPPPPDLALVRNPEGGTEIRLRGQDGLEYAIEASMDLAGWEPWATVRAAGLVAFHPHGAPGSPFRFFRARLRHERRGADGSGRGPRGSRRSRDAAPRKGDPP